ncbi:MAG TPA: glycoside hydrolase family 43 protein [Salinimicrobium sp.]|nr:glycoside hydrolase family 43 protein [Salinimicrobium sp.]
MKLKNKISYYSYLIFGSLFIQSCFTSCEDVPENSGNGNQEAQKITEFYTNPVIDQNFPDPTVIKAGDGFYYVYSTNSEVDGEVMNIQVKRSKDLIHWETLADALPEGPDWADRDFWAPHVIYDENTKKYYLYYSGESIDEEIGKCLGVAISDSPEGPFKDIGKPLLCGKSFINIDPMPFDDPATGKKYLYWGSGHESIKVRELTHNRLGFKEGSEVISLIEPVHSDDPNNYENLVEGAWVIKKGEYYYLFYSGDNCCGEKAHYAVMVARSKNATGPFVKFESESGSNVILSKNEQWIAPGHNSIIKDDSGNYWMFYHAIDANQRGKGRVMLMDKIKFINGWPVINGGSPSINKKNAPNI